MPNNLMKASLRYLWRNKLYTFLNLTGLTLSMAAACFAFLYIRDENSFDNFHTNGQRIYRVTTSFLKPGADKSGTIQGTGQVQGPAFKASIPEIENYTRIWSAGESFNMIGGNKALAVKSLYVDDNFFQVFSFPLVSGNPASVLTDKYSIVLSEATAIRFFGTTDVTGKTIRLEEGNGIENFRITGVARTIPANSSIDFEAVLPFQYLQTMFSDHNWLNDYLSTFVQLKSFSSVELVQKKMAAVFRSEASQQLAEAKQQGNQYSFGLQPMASIHLGNGAETIKENTLTRISSITYSYLLTGIVAFILTMVCINFVNLTIASALKRSKEIGIRKIAGASKKQIVFRFLAEALLICAASLVFAVLLVETLLPLFNQLAQKSITLTGSGISCIIGYGVLLIVMCMLLSGLYPAIRLSGFNAAGVLYGKISNSQRNYFGKVLIVLQFTIAVGLIVATLVYYRQMNFIANDLVGYSTEGLVKVNLPPQRVSGNVLTHLMNTLGRDPSIASMSNGLMTATDQTSISVNGNNHNVNLSTIDPFFIPTLDVKVIKGRNFSADYPSDSSQSIIVNESFVREMQISDPVGATVGLQTNLNRETKTIVGVVADYHYASLKEKINPIVLQLGQTETMWVKLTQGKYAKGLSALERSFRATFPDHYYSYAFVADENARLYVSEQRWKIIICIATVIAILICCLGLFGLIHLEAGKRTKEIGIRKVLGSSVRNIVMILSGDFLKLVGLSIVIGCPIAWYFMTEWLQQFAYKITITWWTFGAAGLGAISIAFATLALQAIKAAQANPVKSLKSQ